jgi:4-hydroxybenzoyl-CoA thioesterase
MQESLPWTPFVHRRVVTWGDTDSAAIVYTARFLDYMLEAIEALMRERIGADWYRMNVEENVGTPFVNVGLDFKSPVTPREPLDIRVLVVRVGRSSVTYAVQGSGAESGVLKFTGSATSVFVTARDVTHAGSRDIPDVYRRPLEMEAAHAAALQEA